MTSKHTDAEIEKLLTGTGAEDKAAYDANNDADPHEAYMRKQAENGWAAGDGYDNLTDWYWAALHAFCLMMSRAIPEGIIMQGGTPISGAANLTKPDETVSSKAGVEAMGACVKVLEKQIEGTPPIYVPINEMTKVTLAYYYEQSMIQYIGDISLALPRKFMKNTDRKTEVVSCKAAIGAFERGISELQKALTEL